MAKRLPIITHPNPLLRQKGAVISIEKLKSKQFQSFLDDMSKTMDQADGIGLAATQVGEIVMVCVINMDDGPMHFINPKIISYGKKKEISTEGCLSVPGVAGDVRRATEVTVEALNRFGEELSFTGQDLFARVLQHEIDHLNGILYIDRAERIWEDREKKSKKD